IAAAISRRQKPAFKTGMEVAAGASSAGKWVCTMAVMAVPKMEAGADLSGRRAQTMFPRQQGGFASCRRGEQPIGARASKGLCVPGAQNSKVMVVVTIGHPSPTEPVAEVDVQTSKPDLPDGHESRDGLNVALAQRLVTHVAAEKSPPHRFDPLRRAFVKGKAP